MVRTYPATSRNRPSRHLDVNTNHNLGFSPSAIQHTHRDTHRLSTVQDLTKRVGPQKSNKHDDQAFDRFENDASTHNCHLSCQTLGKHPKPDCSQFYIRRKDSFTKKVTMVPKMIFNAEANRAAIPEHELYEDDWRAYRSALHNQANDSRARLTHEERKETFCRDNILASQCLGRPIDTNAVYQASKNAKPSPNSGKVEVETYENAVPSPYGYMYRRFANEQSEILMKENMASPLDGDDPGARKEAIRIHLPVIDMDDPFKKYHVPEEMRDGFPKTEHPSVFFDTDAILVDGMPERINVYNEPDSVPRTMLHDDFTRPLPERTMRAVGMNKNLKTREDKRTKIGSPFILPHTQKEKQNALTTKHGNGAGGRQRRKSIVDLCEQRNAMVNRDKHITKIHL